MISAARSNPAQHMVPVIVIRLHTHRSFSNIKRCGGYLVVITGAGPVVTYTLFSLMQSLGFEPMKP